MGVSNELLRLHRLLDVGRALTGDLDEETVLERVLQTARELTGARYAALGVLNERKDGLAQFVAVGMDQREQASVGPPPCGRGLLGMLIEEPRPVRLKDLREHPRSSGFPASHPPMHSFLGVPVLIRGQTWGVMYLTEKDGGEFTEEDQQAAATLADWAAIAVENARLFAFSEKRRADLEQALSGLQATQDVLNALGGDIALEHTLELIAQRGRTLVAARSLVIMLVEGRELVVHARAGDTEDLGEVRLALDGSASGAVLAAGQPERFADVHTSMRGEPERLGVFDARSVLLAPVIYRGQALGLFAAFDRGAAGEAFADEDEQILRAFATGAATAVMLARSVQAERLRSSLAAADAERRRWARELHDETLQSLGGLRLLLASALRVDDHRRAREAMREAIEHIEQEIAGLRGIITELRSAALEELGLEAALEALAERLGTQSGIEVHLEIDLQERAARAGAAGDCASAADLDNTVYRLVQEALTNVAKHAGAGQVRLCVKQRDCELLVEVQDDGDGFDPEARSGGYGLAGMRERVSLAGGLLDVSTGPAGTLLKALLPAGESLSPFDSAAAASAS